MEMLLSMALLSIFIVVLLDIVVSVLNAQNVSEANSSITQDGRYIMSRIDYDVQRASSITTPAAIGGSGTTLAMVIGGVTYTYTLSGTNLQLNVGANTDNINSSETTIPSAGFSFTRIGNPGGKDTIRMNYTVNSVNTTHSGAKSRTFTTTFGRRL